MAAQPVKLITDGRLEDYLIGREPVKDFAQSNGHGRAGIRGSARPMIGVLKITAKNGLTDEELNRKLMDMAKDSGLKSVYFVQTMAGDTPRLIYRVNADGTRQLLRGAKLEEIDYRAPRSSIVGRGQRPVCGQLFRRRAADRAGARAPVRRCHHQAGQREKRQAAVLSPAGVIETRSRE